MATKFVEGRDWKRLDYVGMQGNLHVYSAICLHCHLCFKSHRSIATHALLCPRYPPNMEKKSSSLPEKILKHRIEKNELQYLVHWKNPSEKDSWVPFSKLENAHDALKAYWSKELPPLDPIPKKAYTKGKNSKSQDISEENDDDPASSGDEMESHNSDFSSPAVNSPSEKETTKNQVIVYGANQVCVETQTRKRYATRKRKNIEVLDVEKDGDDLKWTISIGGKIQTLSNAEMKMNYLNTVINFYESNTSFIAPCEKLQDSVVNMLRNK